MPSAYFFSAFSQGFSPACLTDTDTWNLPQSDRSTSSTLTSTRWPRRPGILSRLLGCPGRARSMPDWRVMLRTASLWSTCSRSNYVSGLHGAAVSYYFVPYWILLPQKWAEKRPWCELLPFAPGAAYCHRPVLDDNRITYFHHHVIGAGTAILFQFSAIGPAINLPPAKSAVQARHPGTPQALSIAELRGC